MITYFQSFILGLLQGVTELFPISSLGHSVLIPPLLGWHHIDQGGNYFLVFLVATHLATSLVLFAFFFKDWVLIIKGVLRSLKNRVIDQNDAHEKVGWLIIVGTIPAGILGVLFEEKLKLLFASPKAVAIFLFLNGLVLFTAEYLTQRKKSAKNDKTGPMQPFNKLTWAQSVKIGCAQCLALIPGFSRTGATLGGGLLVGLNHENAARFSFLLATPIIFAAAALKLPDLFSKTAAAIGPVIFGAVVAAIGAYVSVKFLLKYFQTKTLRPFAWYCCAAGIIAFLAFQF